MSGSDLSTMFWMMVLVFVASVVMKGVTDRSDGKKPPRREE